MKKIEEISHRRRIHKQTFSCPLKENYLISTQLFNKKEIKYQQVLISFNICKVFYPPKLHHLFFKVLAIYKIFINSRVK